MEKGRAVAIRADVGRGGGRGMTALTERATTVAMTAGTPLIARAARGADDGCGLV